MPRRRKATDPAKIVSLGWTLIDWIETYLVHGPGDIHGEPIHLDDEFAAFLVRAYELDPKTGRRLVNRAFLSRSKGRAKSELAGMISCAELLAPVRFDGWDANGEPVGRPIRDPFIRCLATEEGQSGNTYDNVQVMLGHVAEQHDDEYPGLDVGLTRTFLRSGGEVRPSTAASASKDGGKETFSVADETHLWVLPELRAMHETVTRNLTKRKIAQPWMLETSTMYQPGQASVAEATHDYARQIAAGKARNRGLLFDHREGPLPEDWDDDKAVLAALEQAYGAAAPWTDLERILDEIRDPKTTKAAGCRYFLNRPVAEVEQWVEPLAWAALKLEREPPAHGAPIALGFDGSDSDDRTALVGVTMDSPPHLFVLGWWEPDVTTGTIDREPVRAAVDATFRQWRVVRMLCDPPYWRTEVSEWAAAHGDKIVLEYPTRSWSRMAQAVDRTTTLITTTGALTHDGNSVLAEHVANARRRNISPTRPEMGFIITKDHPNSPRKIDLAVAGVLAVEARDGALDSPGQGAAFLEYMRQQGGGDDQAATVISPAAPAEAEAAEPPAPRAPRSNWEARNFAAARPIR